mgnify:CR=1 FL=1
MAPGVFVVSLDFELAWGVDGGRVRAHGGRDGHVLVQKDRPGPTPLAGQADRREDVERLAVRLVVRRARRSKFDQVALLVGSAVTCSTAACRDASCKAESHPASGNERSYTKTWKSP